MTANPQSSETPEPKEIRDFRQKYDEAISHARVSEEHTTTQGWQNLYADHRDSVRARQDGIADRFTAIIECLRQRLLTEDEEKEVADLKKALSELRTQDEAFQRQVIDPIMAPMVECNAVIEAARASARETERGAPLHTRGLAQAMETVIDTMPRVKFMVSSGRLTVG